jgi:hypothetical protein
VGQIPPPLRAAIRALVGGKSPWPLLLHGPAGTGKTCAALALLDHGGGEYFTAWGLAEAAIQSQQGRMRRCDGAGDGYTVYPDEFWRQVGEEPLVVLDELGCRERVSDHHYECVRRLLDERIGLPLVAISNLPLSRLAQVYDDRVASRLGAGTVVGLGGEDRRLG